MLLLTILVQGRICTDYCPKCTYLEVCDQLYKSVIIILHRWTAKKHELQRLTLNGDTIKIIQRDYKDRCEGACQVMLQRRLDGIDGTLSCTWKSMIKALDESNHSKLALLLKSAII